MKQGCTLPPILFRVYIEAVDEIIRARLESAGIKHVPFYTLNDFIMAGRKSSQLGAQFTMYQLFFADDGYFHFESRQLLLSGAIVIFDVMKAFGLTCHVGRNGKKSKTEAVYIPRAGKFELADTSDLFVDGGNIPFVKQFKYLASYIPQISEMILTLTPGSRPLAQRSPLQGRVFSLQRTSHQHIKE
jgi:hypothetical protein